MGLQHLWGWKGSMGQGPYRIEELLWGRKGLGGVCGAGALWGRGGHGGVMGSYGVGGSPMGREGAVGAAMGWALLWESYGALWGGRGLWVLLWESYGAVGSVGTLWCPMGQGGLWGG